MYLPTNTNLVEVFTVFLVFHTESIQTLHGLHRLFGLSADSTQTLLRMFLAEHSANFKFLVTAWMVGLFMDTLDGLVQTELTVLL